METEFTEESVKQFLLSKGGRVKNNELVKRFKNFLHDSSGKDKFKTFVNTLATIKMDDNEKMIILKKKFQKQTDSGGGGGAVQDWTTRARSEPPGNQEKKVPDYPDGGMQSRVRSDGMLTAGELHTSQSTLSTNDTTSMSSAISSSSLSSGGQEVEDENNASVMSVKERARHLNRIESEVELQAVATSPLGATRPKDRKHGDGEESMTSSVGSYGYLPLAPLEKEWLVKCSSSEYHLINEMLCKNPELVKVRDFTSGYTAIHWACKHGRAEVIKMLMGKPGINVNQRSNGGYTPLHLAAMNGHENVIELLVQTFKADPNIRDYSGKKAKQYLRNSASSRAQQLLVSSRLGPKHSNQDKGENFMRNTTSRKSNRDSVIKSLIRASAGTVRQTILKSSWGSMEDVNGDKDHLRTSPYQSPRHSAEPSPNINRKAYRQRDQDMMPPPSGAPSRHKSKRPPHSISKESLFTEDKKLSVARQVPRSESEPNLGDVTQPSKATFI